MTTEREADRGAVAIAVPAAGPSCLKGGGGGRKPRREDDVDLEAGSCAVEKARDWAGELEKLCRICHLDSGDGAPAASELIQLGCACKGELGNAHRPCAEAWFRIKGDRCCEICGANANNISGEEDTSFMETWHGGRMGRGSRNRDSSERNTCMSNQPFCNFLILCFVVALVLPWFFHASVL